MPKNTPKLLLGMGLSALPLLPLVGCGGGSSSSPFPTATPSATATSTGTPGATSTPTGTPRATATATGTPKATATPTSTSAPTVNGTPLPTTGNALTSVSVNATFSDIATSFVKSPFSSSSGTENFFSGSESGDQLRTAFFGSSGSGDPLIGFLIKSPNGSISTGDVYALSNAASSNGIVGYTDNSNNQNFVATSGTLTIESKSQLQIPGTNTVTTTIKFKITNAKMVATTGRGTGTFTLNSTGTFSYSG